MKLHLGYFIVLGALVCGGIISSQHKKQKKTQHRISVLKEQLAQRHTKQQKNIKLLPKKENQTLNITVTVISSTVMTTAAIKSHNEFGGEWPKGGATYTLRVNGKLVDTITNTSTFVTFDGVNVKVGDKLTARCIWTNGFGATAKSFHYPHTPFPIVKHSKTTYSIELGEVWYQWNDD